MGTIEPQGDACHLPAPAQGGQFMRWLRAYRVPILFGLAMLAMAFCRDLWSPDEPDFAQCVREMRERGSWLLPYLNGQPYSEKPILFYWLMKGSAVLFDKLTGGLGFDHGVAAWALRLPSVAASVLFMAGLRKWSARFLQADLGDLACLILAAVPIWVLQTQMIQIDMVFAALLAWSWLCLLGAWLLLRDHANPRYPLEERRWLAGAYLGTALAFLAKGPLAVVLGGGVVLAFLAWQRDFKVLGKLGLGWGLPLMAAVIAPWYLAAAIHGGPAYAYQMIVHQNFERALHAWDHIQPFWRYVQYFAGDAFPWCLLAPALALFLVRSGAHRSPAARFLICATVVPFLLLSCSQSKQGKYLLMIYPFLALLLAALLQPLAVEAVGSTRLRRLGGTLAAGLALPGLALAAVAFAHAGGHKLQAEVAPYLGPLRLCAAILLLGALSVAVRAWTGEGRHLVRETSTALLLVFLAAGTWGAQRLDPRKNYRAWTRAAQPLLAGHQAHFWQTIRSGVMVYTDHQMPELHDAAELLALGPGDRVVAMARDWDEDRSGLTPAVRARFTELLRVPVGGGEAILLAPRAESSTELP